MTIPLHELPFRHRLASPAAWLVLITLLAALVWIASKLLWLALDWNQPLPEPLPLMQTSAPAPPAASLSRWHLFGNAAPLQDNRALASNAPETQLQLTLLGVWAGRDPRIGRAMIADAAGVETGFKVGAEVAPGVVLDQVLKDRVVLSRGGASEVLMLSREPRTATTGTSAAGNSSTMPRSGASAAPAGAAIGMPIPGGVMGVPQLPMQGVDMEAVRKSLGADPRDLAQNVTATPVMENGKFVGVRLFSAKYAGSLAKLGLQPEDVVTQVNGVDVSDPGRIAGVLNNLSSGGRLSVAVRRNGKIENLNVDLN
jgi:general secretion pathway protein C